MKLKFFPVTILPDGRKIPLVDGWQYRATDNPEQIKAWQNEFGSRLSHWGVPTGPDSGLLVLDVDDGGEATLAQYPVPTTVEQRSLKGGRHLLFQYPNDGKHYGNRVKFLPGLDVRGAGGYIVWYGNATQAPVAAAPPWLVQALAAREKTAVDPNAVPVALSPELALKRLQEAWQAVCDATPGDRNNILNTQSYLVGQIVAGGSIPRADAERVMLHAASLIGLNPHEAQATINSGLDGGIRQPLTSPFGDAPPGAPGVPHPPPAPSWTPDLLTEQDLMNVSKLRKPQLFEDWSTEDIMITTADGGTGKSTLKLQEAICLATGQRFLGFRCVNPGRTLYITGEDDAAKLAALVGKIAGQMGLLSDPQMKQLILQNVVIKMDTELCLVEKDRSGFLRPSRTALENLLHAVERLKPRMIVFDPIASFWGSEAGLNDMAQAVIKVMRQLVSRGVAVEMINHMGKASSANKDVSQFAGRGGTGLPSHSRVSRVLHGLSAQEYQDMTNSSLEEGSSAIQCVINKFSDGSQLLGKPFILVRQGYVFTRRTILQTSERETEQRVGDLERVFLFIKGERKEGRYPTDTVVVAHFMLASEPMSEARVKRALKLAEYTGHLGEKIKRIQHPDQSITDKCYVILGFDGREL